jgi:hypothetical protein
LFNYVGRFRICVPQLLYGGIADLLPPHHNLAIHCGFFPSQSFFGSWQASLSVSGCSQPAGIGTASDRITAPKPKMRLSVMQNGRGRSEVKTARFSKTHLDDCWFALIFESPPFCGGDLLERNMSLDAALIMPLPESC